MINHNLVPCVGLLKGTLFKICCWFLNIETSANSIPTPAWTKLVLTFVFSPWGTSQPFWAWWRTTHSTSGLCLGAILNTNSQIESNNEKKLTWYILQKGLVYSRRTETRQSAALLALSVECAHGVSPIFCYSAYAHGCEWQQKHEYWF